ncbi:MAG: NADH-quinone oxidoreductase subunit H [Deltaproteobacteria bacterium RIFOXYD12_FULL_50_9]|nr:MAG: NADH-quinone oxidoreductase subunit H [Deltaproteobacteria bacterium RIFOXYD12_FULL_50_9]
MGNYTELLRLLAYLVGIIAFAALNAAYLVWLERKEAAHIQRRIGPKEVGPYGLLQPLADGIKLMTKQLIVPAGADVILFKVAPLLILAPAIASFVTIPFSETLVARNINLGLLMIFAFASLNVMGVLIGGWGSNNKYAVISAARAVSQNVAYEIPMLITAITMVMVAGTMNLNEIVMQQPNIFKWYIFRFTASPLMPVAFLIFFICSLAETNRAPFDMAEAESELVAGAYTEYSGMGFGVFFMGEYANVVIGCSLATILFLGGWQSPFGVPADAHWSLFLFKPGILWFLIKLYLLCFTVIWVRWTYPRTQFYGLLNLSWKYLIPISLFNLLLTGAMLKVFQS